MFIFKFKLCEYDYLINYIKRIYITLERKISGGIPPDLPNTLQDNLHSVIR